MKLLSIFKNQYFWLLLIIFLGLSLRLYKLDSPIADWHSWRQVDTAAVTRNFIKDGFNPLFPKYDDMSGVSEYPVINPLRFRFVEFPLYNIFVYPLYLIFGVSEQYHRLVSVIFSLGSLILLFLIVRRYLSITAALMSAFIFAILPFNVFFSRTTLPEPTFIFFALGMVYFVDGWIKKPSSYKLGLTGFAFTAIAFLIKPWAIFFFLPLLYLVVINNNTKKFWIKFIIFTITALLPFILWRGWILQHPEGIPASSWLLNSDGIRFRPAFWWWIFSERLGREILGVTGLALFIFGIILKPKNNYFFHFWALSSFLFVAIFATGNVRHDYYQTQLVPILSVFVSIGFLQFFKGNRLFLARVFTIPFAIFLLFLSIFFGYKAVRDFYNINNPNMVEAGKKADQVLPKDAIVLAPYNGDTAFLYQINRPGFAIEALPMEELVADYGVTHYVSTTRDDKTNKVLEYFLVLEDNPDFVIADLTKLIKPLDKEKN